jgi:molybdenum cofactor cytidylyltransferase
LRYCTQNANGHASQERPALTIVILAAGRAARMGRQKLLLPIDGEPMIARVIAAAADWPTVVVAGAEVATAIVKLPVGIIENGAPERGMSHSLALADAAIPADEPLAVLLGDLPDISAQTIAAVIAAYDATATDIVIARSGTHLTHPVIFGPQARKHIATLPDGDSQKALRDNPELRRRYVDIAVNERALTDIDTPQEYAARIRHS